MAKDTYTAEVSPLSFLRQDEEEQGLIPNGGNGPPVRRRGRHAPGTLGRDKITMAEMKVQMTSLWKEQFTYVEIAERVNDEFGLVGEEAIKGAAVQYHIKTLLDTARKQSLMHVNERQALILARYDQIEMLATEAYFASMSSDTINYERQIKRAKSKDREKQLAADLKRERKRVERANIKRAKEHRPLLHATEPDPIVGDLPDLLETTAENIKEYQRTESKPAGDPRFLAMLIDITDKKARLFHLLNRTDVENPDQELAKLPDEERRSRMAAVLHQAMTRRTNDKGALAEAGPLGGFQEGEEPDPLTRIEIAEPEEIEEQAPEVEWEFD